MEEMKIKEEEYLTGKFTPTCMEETPRKRPLSKCIVVSTLSDHRHLTVTKVNTALNSLKECFYINT